MVSLPLAHHTNRNTSSNNNNDDASSSIAIDPFDTENSTHRQPSLTIAECIPPYCYDVVNKTLNTIQNDKLPLKQTVSTSETITGTTTTNSGYHQSERFDDDSHTFTTNIDDTHWSSTSVMYGILMLATRDYVNEQCYSELRMIYNGIRRKDAWAIKGQF